MIMIIVKDFGLGNRLNGEIYVIVKLIIFTIDF